jgi:hypothetical protein
MRVKAIFFVVLLSTTLVACAPEKSVCPQIPIYPNAQSIGYKQVETVQRITSYRTSDSPEQVTTYYKGQLRGQAGNSLVTYLKALPLDIQIPRTSHPLP